VPVRQVPLFITASLNRLNFFSSINDKATQAKNAAIKKKPTIHDKKHLNRFFFLPLALRRFIRKFEEKR